MDPLMPMDAPHVGDRVKVVVAPHMEGHDEGVVRQVVHGALGIEFDGMPGVVHQWYVPSEVMVTEQAAMPDMPGDRTARTSGFGTADERRMLLVPIEVREASDDKPAVLEGYAARFNEETQIGGDAWGWMERIAPGAFKDSIKADDIRALFNHDSNQVLGRNTAGTLTLKEDDKGLRVVIQPPDTTAARDVVTLIKRGDVSGMSFMFRSKREEWAEPTKKGELPKRTLLEVKLFDVGPVVFPAYPTTSIAARDQAKAFVEALARPAIDEALVRARARNRLDLEIAGIEV